MLKQIFEQKVKDYGGYACYHAHFDKAYTITIDNLNLSLQDMQAKWHLFKDIKVNYTYHDLYTRMSRAINNLMAQGVTHCRTMVDADSTVKLLPLQVALELKKSLPITFEIAIQPLEGVLEPDAKYYFTKACEQADVIGGLPSRDLYPEKHLDYIMSLAKDMNKRLDVHVDQENNPDEHETELLAKKTIEHGLQGKVSAIHAISLAAQEPKEQERVISLLKEAEISVIVCPSAAISMKQLSKSAPLHNSIAPVKRLLDNGVKVLLGVDNICDLFMPLCDGDMWFESRLLMESCRFYDLEKVAKIASDKSQFISHSAA